MSQFLHQILNETVVNRSVKLKMVQTLFLFIFLHLNSFPEFFQHILRHQFESWFIHLVVCTTNWVHVSPAWGSCDLLHVVRLGTVKWSSLVIHNTIWQVSIGLSLRKITMLWRNMSLDVNTSEIRCLKPDTIALLRKATRRSLMLANGRIRQSLTALIEQSLRDKPYVTGQASCYMGLRVCCIKWAVGFLVSWWSMN